MPPHLKPEKAAKIQSQFPSNTASPNHTQIPTNVPIRRGEGRAGLRMKVTGTIQLLEPKVFLQSPQIQRPTLPSQNLHIPSNQRVIHPTSVERKQIVPSLSHGLKVQSRSEVNSTEITK